MPITAGLLFDLDGTMLDTDTLHLEAFQILLSGYGRSVTEHYYRTKIMGAPIEQIMEGLFPELSAAKQWKLGEEKERLFRGLLTGPLQAKAGLFDVFDWADVNRIGICVVTNAPRDNAEMMLSGLGLINRIRFLLIGAELLKSKPDPFPYQEGMRLLNVDPSTAVAFEDSGPGVQSASSAGLHTFGMLGGLEERELRDKGASCVIADFRAPELWRKLTDLAQPVPESPR
ncbi:HAD family phosphatase [Rhizobium sp. CFBP 8762]|uniref:HAD family hydrolase n=1 Tax=Rhizobium sp. CFBP 8762 TaxID=2775279 RepID=UPI0017807DFD|nr:HAD family phosphatase [Rhizobium sp. CFBP 8762]MBD8555181.1 HAD family phosphatase [Rhizobium sp. CFBP 8762]